MPFREKVRKVLRRTISSENHEPTLASAGKPDVEVYKPGEAPRPKYRGNWSKEHQEKLHAFSFAAIGEAFDNSRKSSFSSLSPGASRRSSRRSSWSGVGKKGKPQQHEPRHVGQMVENAEDEDEDDPSIDKQSTPQTPSDKQPSPHPLLTNGATQDEEDDNDNIPLAQQETITNANAHQHQTQNDTPFTPDELTRALTATKIQDQDRDQEKGGTRSEAEAEAKAKEAKKEKENENNKNKEETITQ